MMIGGVGVEVERDESKFGRRKYKLITGKAFMVEVAKRDAATLIPIIQQ